MGVGKILWVECTAFFGGFQFRIAFYHFRFDITYMFSKNSGLRPVLPANALFSLFFAETALCTFCTGARSFG